MDFPFTVVTESAKETQRLGQGIAQSAVKGDHGARVYCLWGELGSGKTTFTQGFAKGLGVISRLLSPTFIIVRRYSLKKPLVFLYHLDLYRMHGEHDLETIGFDEIIQEPNSIVVVEWPDRLGTSLPKKRIDIRFIVRSNDKHVIQFEEHR